MNRMQRIIAKHQHTDGLIALFPQHQMSGNISYDFGPNQGHGTHSSVAQRYNEHSISPGHFMNGTGYSWKVSSYTDIHSTAFANDNEIRNPGFEDAGAGTPELFEHWYDQPGDGAITSDAVVVRTGLASAKLTAGDNPCWVKAYNFYVTSGATYEVTYWAYGDGVNESRHQVVEHTMGQVVATTGNGVTAAAWTKVSFEFTVPDGGRIIRVYLHSPDVNGGFVYFDDLDVRSPFGFKGYQGSIVAFVQVEATHWGDFANNCIINLAADVENFIQIRKDSANDTITFQYMAGAVEEILDHTPITTLEWFAVGMTWDLAEDEVKYYIDGALIQTDTVLGEWIGDLADTSTTIGASTTEPLRSWNGGIGIVGIYNEAKTPTEMLYLSKP